MKKPFLFFSLTIFLFSFEVFGLPRFTLRTGGQCMDCHVNPTGGSMRSEGGWNFGKNSLSMYSTFKNDDFEMSPMIGKNVSFGLDFRTQYLVKLDSAEKKSDFQKMTGALYFNAGITEKMNLYARYDYVWGIWEAYGVAHIFPNNGYLKVGSYTPNFGIRIDDHTAYTKGGDMGVVTPGKDGFMYEPRYVETGLELGFFLSDLAFWTFSVGNNGLGMFTRDPSYTTRIEFMPKVRENINLFVGGSYAVHKLGLANKRNVNLYGGFLGIGINQFTLLAEYDIAQDYFDKDIKGSAMMIEASYKISKGLDAVIRYDRYDPNSDVKKDELAHIIVGAEWFPFSFLEIRPQYRIQTEKPKVDNNSIVLQFHFWY